MKKSRKISVFVTLAVSLIFLSCSNPSSSGNGSDSNNGGESAPTSTDNPGNTTTNPDNPSGTGDTPDNPDNTPTNPDTPSGGSDTSDNPNGDGDTQAVTPNPETPKYEWIYTKYESSQQQQTDYYEMSSTSVSDYSYLYYTDKNNYKYTSTTVSLGSTTVNGTTTPNQSETKIIYSSSQEGDSIKGKQFYYVKENTEWSLSQESEMEYYKYASWLTQSTHSILYPYTINGVEISGSESTKENTIVLLEHNGDIEKYKVTEESGIYTICEFKNGKIQKRTTYRNDNSKSTEAFYSQSNNTIINTYLPDYNVYHFKYYDTDGITLTTEITNELGNVVNNGNTIVINSTLTTTSNNTTSQISITETYTKMQIPFSNSQQ